MSNLNASNLDLDLDQPNIEDYLPSVSIQEPLGKLRLRDLLDISPTLTEAVGAIVDACILYLFLSAYLLVRKFKLLHLYPGNVSVGRLGVIAWKLEN
ncbi:hypothetical protein Tco_1465009 [Tanacetum coccineum]